MNTPSDFPEDNHAVPEASEAQRTKQIAALNDQLRITGQGGQVVITQGVQAMGEQWIYAVFNAVRQFNQFTPDNDPYGEHDFGMVELNGQKFFWKIDYYDSNMQYLSEDPANPAMTNRVMTIMLASEY